MTRLINKLAMLAKVETTYGTDAVPTGAANAIQVTNCKYKLEAEEVSRDLLKPYMGHQGVIWTGKYVTISGEVEIAGAGAAGTAPAYGPLLRMGGFAETITASTDVKYNFVSGAFEAGSLYYNLDGVNHIALGSRCNIKASLKPKEIPRFTFDFKGLLGTISDTSLPAVDYSDFIKPVVVNKANTTFSLHGYAGPTEGVSIDMGSTIEPRLIINYEGMEYTGREATGEAIMDAVALATKNWFAIAQAHTTGAMVLQHGTVAGNIVKFEAPAVQIGMPDYGDSQKIVNNTLKLMFTPTDAGNDELTITIK